METCPVCAYDELLYPLECSHKLCLKCVKGVCIHAGACPCCRAELSSAYKTRITTMPVAIRDVGTDIDTRIGNLLAAGAVWAYSAKSRGCWLYDENTQREIKDASDAGLTGLDITACGCVVHIDLVGCTQQNPTTHAKRRIRKISTDASEIKGIAGMPRASRPRHAATSSGILRRLSAESLASYRARVNVAFHAAGNETQRTGEGKVHFNRRMRDWAMGKSS